MLVLPSPSFFFITKFLHSLTSGKSWLQAEQHVDRGEKREEMDSSLTAVPGYKIRPLFYSYALHFGLTRHILRLAPSP